MVEAHHDGFAIIICALTAACVMALLCPVKDEESEGELGDYQGENPPEHAPADSGAEAPAGRGETAAPGGESCYQDNHDVNYTIIRGTAASSLRV